MPPPPSLIDSRTLPPSRSHLRIDNISRTGRPPIDNQPAFYYRLNVEFQKLKSAPLPSSNRRSLMQIVDREEQALISDMESTRSETTSSPVSDMSSSEEDRYRMFLVGLMALGNDVSLCHRGIDDTCFLCRSKRFNDSGLEIDRKNIDLVEIDDSDDDPFEKPERTATTRPRTRRRNYKALYSQHQQ